MSCRFGGHSENEFWRILEQKYVERWCQLYAEKERLLALRAYKILSVACSTSRTFATKKLDIDKGPKRPMSPYIANTSSLSRLSVACSTSRTFATKKSDIDKGPKRPMSPYIAYWSSISGELKAKYPDKNVVERATMAGEMFKKLEEQEKKKLVDVYTAQMEKYKVEKDAWKQTQSKEDQKTLSLKRKEERALKELSKPKQPAWGYLLFIKQKWATMSYGERSDSSMVEKGRGFAKEWAGLSYGEKKKYDNSKEKEQYDLKLFEWEKAMVEKGVPSLVRVRTLRKLGEDAPRNRVATGSKKPGAAAVIKKGKGANS